MSESRKSGTFFKKLVRVLKISPGSNLVLTNFDQNWQLSSPFVVTFFTKMYLQTAITNG
jgi:hypothetical protein